MREKTVCPHRAEELCSCAPVKNKGKDISALAVHIAVNMTDIRWELEYTDIDRPEKRRLCRVGSCRICGGRLCHDVDTFDHLAGDDFLAAVYRHLYEIHNAGDNHMDREEFCLRFVEMFHEQDRPRIRKWLDGPESRHESHACCQCVSAEPMAGPGEEVKIYTIIRTGVDAEKGDFPEPQSEGSFLSFLRAKAELRKLVTAEKDELDDRYDCEEYDENYWEAYQDGYAAALSTRLEIITSELRLTPPGNPTEDFRPADYLEQCAECYGTYGTPCCKDEENECGILEDAMEELARIQAEEAESIRRLSQTLFLGTA